jgi:hypothetical protein
MMVDEEISYEFSELNFWRSSDWSNLILQLSSFILLWYFQYHLLFNLSCFKASIVFVEI